MEGPYENRGDATMPLLFLEPIVCFSEVSAGKGGGGFFDIKGSILEFSTHTSV